MCGIVGVVYRDPRTGVDEHRLAAARDALVHRGPDEAGLWTIPGIGFGHRRLKILDLNRGQQPMLDADPPHARRALVYNGEIYNFRQLQNEYRRRGITFDTRCDTEVLFKALNTDGRTALNRCNGMFAFAHWDEDARRLLMARDRLGQKPLYWYADKEKLAFASELKALLILLDQRFELDVTAIDQFFARGYILSPRTIFQGVHKLPAGRLLELEADPERWNITVEPYWDFEPVEVPTGDAAILDQFEQLMSDAVRLRLVSDVPIGCLLSGGIDSSLITALAAKVSAEPVEAFSIGFDESDELNELPYAEMVAKAHGCHWHRRSMGGGDFAATLEETAAYFDEPYGNFTMFSMRQLAQMAREKLVVVLSGQGGDELTAGYPGRYNWVVQTGPHAAAAAKRCEYAPAIDDVNQHLQHTSFVPWPGARAKMFSDALKAQINDAATPFDDFATFWRRPGGNDRLNRVLYTDVKTNLPDYLVCLEERMSMSCSLEARNPLLDYRVVNFLLSLPASQKIRGRDNKWVLKQLALRHVPAAAIDRPKKGFTPPLGLWIEQGAAKLRDIFRETDGRTAGLYSGAWRDYLLAGQYSAATTMPVFYGLMFAVWAKRYGQYVANWPTAGVGIASITGAIITPNTRQAAPDSDWQAAFRAQDGAAVARGRWFCQAMSNFKDGDTIEIIGDRDDWYRYLAEENGLTVAEPGVRPMDGVVVIGVESLAAGLERSQAAMLKSGAQLLWFVPFALAEQARVQAALRQAAGQISFAGSQAVPVSSQQAVLIARAPLETAIEQKATA